MSVPIDHYDEAQGSQNWLGPLKTTLNETIDGVNSSVHSAEIRDMVPMTAADYAALPVKDPNTLYVTT